VKQKLKSFGPYTLIFLIAIVIFGFSIIKSSTFNPAATKPASVATLEQQLADKASAAAKPEPKSSTGSKAPFSKTTAKPTTQPSKALTRLAPTTQPLNNTGPGDVIALFIITVVMSTIGFQLFQLNRASSTN
jgi:hypothetical protein